MLSVVVSTLLAFFVLFFFDVLDLVSFDSSSLELEDEELEELEEDELSDLFRSIVFFDTLRDRVSSCVTAKVLEAETVDLLTTDSVEIFLLCDRDSVVVRDKSVISVVSLGRGFDWVVVFGPA